MLVGIDSFLQVFNCCVLADGYPEHAASHEEEMIRHMSINLTIPFNVSVVTCDVERTPSQHTVDIGAIKSVYILASRDCAFELSSRDDKENKIFLNFLATNCCSSGENRSISDCDRPREMMCDESDKFVWIGIAITFVAFTVILILAIMYIEGVDYIPNNVKFCQHNSAIEVSWEKPRSPTKLRIDRTGYRVEYTTTSPTKGDLPNAQTIMPNDTISLIARVKDQGIVDSSITVSALYGCLSSSQMPAQKSGIPTCSWKICIF